MQREAYLVVISVLEGRNFPLRYKHKLITECKFDGELLATDPIDHVETPHFTTELAWEMDRKALHQHKMQRTPLKLQCYAVDTITMVRENVGYVLLDLRGAQQSTHTAKWYNLLSSKYSRIKPAIKIAMILEDNATPTQSLFKANDAPPRPVQVPTLKIEFSLNEDEGYFQLGPNKSSCELFVLAITLGSAFNLEQLISSDESLPSIIPGFFFYYSLFGSDIINDSFDNLICPDITPERASIKIHSTLDSIKAYFMQNPELKVHLCCGEQVLGEANIHFLTLISKKKLSVINTEPVVIEGSYTLNRPGKALQLKAAKPCVSISLTLRKESVGKNPACVDTPLQLSNQTSSQTAPPGAIPKHDINQNSISAADQFVKATPNAVTNEEQGVKPLKSEVEKASTGPSSSSTGLSSPSKSTLSTGNSLSCESTDTTKYKLTKSTCSNTSTMQHFRFILDILSISTFQLPFPVNIYIQYCYPFFGNFSSVSTTPIEMDSFSEARTGNSKWAFEFVCSYHILIETFTRFPITLEIWCKQKESEDIFLGNAQLILTKLLETSRIMFHFSENMKDKNGFRQTCHGTIPVLSPDSTKVAQLCIVTTLEDMGAAVGQKILPSPKTKIIKFPFSSKKSPMHGPKKNRLRDSTATNKQNTAIELELWQSRERENFTQKLKEAEAQHLKHLGDEFSKRDKEREVMVAKQVSEYQALEKQLSQTINGLEKREKQVSAAEEEVSHLQQNTLCEKERTINEIKEASRRMKEDCVHQVQLEKQKRSLLEEHNKKLLKQVRDMEEKCNALLEEFYGLKNKQNSRPKVRLQEEINITKLEISEAERKLESTNKSKLHYKHQWGRTLKELAVMRKKNQDQALAVLQQQQQEMEAIKLHYLASGEKTAITDDQGILNQIQKDIEIIKQRKCINQVSSIVIEHCDEMPLNIPVINKRVSRLIEERDTLLRTGVYSQNDRIISELDCQINDEMKRQDIN